MFDFELHDLWRLLVTLILFAAFYFVMFKRLLPRVVATTARQHQMDIVEALAAALNAKDSVTGDHVRRTQVYAEGLGRLAGCTPEELRALRNGAILHDIGKLGIPDDILRKAGPLTDAEFEIIKTHTILGAAIVERVGFLVPVLPIVRNHHERWDGLGYPDGLRRYEIPLTARIMAIVDTFDALREDRSYRKAMTRQQAIDVVMDGAGSRYDPELLGMFLTYLPQFEAKLRAAQIANNGNGDAVAVHPMSPVARMAVATANLE